MKDKALRKEVDELRIRVCHLENILQRAGVIEETHQPCHPCGPFVLQPNDVIDQNFKYQADIVNLILDHLGLKIERQPAQEAKKVLTKVTKKK